MNSKQAKTTHQGKAGKKSKAAVLKARPESKFSEDGKRHWGAGLATQCSVSLLSCSGSVKVNSTNPTMG